LDSEQEALDRMAQRVRLADAPERPTLLDALGFDLRPVTDETVLADIRRRMGHDAGRLERVTEVVHPKLRERFQGHVRSTWRSRTSLLWHGSRSENWLSILEGGLQLHPERAQITGKMFGYGLYFASSFQKSLGYTSARGAVWAGQRSDRGHLALCEVHLGRSLKVHRHESWCYELNGDALAKRAALVPYDSLHACAGQMLRHDEYIVYNEAQVLPRYLVEVSA
ncbi:MAG: ADP-ribose polymerase, partial [Bacteroidota bacterium]